MAVFLDMIVRNIQQKLSFTIPITMIETIGEYTNSRSFSHLSHCDEAIHLGFYIEIELDIFDLRRIDCQPMLTYVNLCP